MYVLRYRNDRKKNNLKQRKNQCDKRSKLKTTAASALKW